MDDYHAFQNTTGGRSGSAGCAPGCLTWVVVGAVILWLIGKLFG